MNIEINTRRLGEPGATFQIVLGDKEIPYRLSVRDAQRLAYVLAGALDRHAAKRATS